MEPQILHGNAHEVYKDLLNDLPAAWAIKPGVMASTESLLDKNADIPNRSLVPLDTPAGMKLMYSVCRRKSKARSTSYFVHRQVLSRSLEQLLHEHVQILVTPTYTEEEFDQIADGAQGVEPTARWGGSRVRVDDPAFLKAALYGIVGRWYAAAPPVVIGVPEGVDYDNYCGTILTHLYKYLPAGIRGRAGFMTYAVPDRSLMEVAVYFLPCGMQKNLLQLGVDNERRMELLESPLPAPLKRMIDTLVDSEPRERQEYLQKLYDIIEEDLDLSEVTGKNYADMLVILELDQNMEDPENFEKLNKAFRGFEKRPAKHRKILLNILNDRVNQQVMDLHFQPREAEKLQEYIQRLDFYCLMLCHSNEKISYARKTLVECFRSTTAAQSTLEGLEDIRSTLSEKRIILDQDTLDQIHGILEEARRKPLQERIGQIISKTDGKLNALKLSGTFAELQQQVAGIREGLEQALSAHLDRLERQPYLEQFSKTETSKLAQWHENAAGLIRKSVSQQLTQAAYEKAKRQLEQRMGDYPDWADCYESVLDDLEQRYQGQGIGLATDLEKRVYEQPNYFAALKAFVEIDEKYGLSDQQYREAYGALQDKRPRTWIDYNEKYNLAYGDLNDESLKPQAKAALQKILKKDERYYLEQDQSIVVTEKTMLLEISHELQGWERDCEKMGCNHTQTVCLKINYNNQKYDRQRLRNTLDCFLEGKSSGEMLDDSEMYALMIQMPGMDIPLEMGIRILKKLLSSGNYTQRTINKTVDLLKKKGIEQEQNQDKYQEMRKLLGAAPSGMGGNEPAPGPQGGYLREFLMELGFVLIAVSVFLAVYRLSDRFFEKRRNAAMPYSTSDSALPAQDQTPDDQNDSEGTANIT